MPATNSREKGLDSPSIPHAGLQRGKRKTCSKGLFLFNRRFNLPPTTPTLPRPTLPRPVRPMFILSEKLKILQEFRVCWKCFEKQYAEC